MSQDPRKAPFKDSEPSSDRQDGKAPNSQRPRPGQSPQGLKGGRGFFAWLLILAFLIGSFIILNNSPRGVAMPSWQNFLLLVDPTANNLMPNSAGDRVVTIEDTRATAVVKSESLGLPASKSGTLIYVTLDPINRNWFYQQLNDAHVTFVTSLGGSTWMTLLFIFASFILLAVLIWTFISRSMRSAGAGPAGMLGSFGKSRHRLSSKDTVSVTFNDVAGVDEAKDEVKEIVEFLRNPKKFQRLGGRIPRGVLLVGNPGCGKTLLAKAIAGEADVPFFSISGSDFVEMFVGVGASRVRDLFKQAKDNSPCIIFLDEIDAVGRRRGGGFTTGGHDEREQTLNAILVEMDGFEANDQVIVIAATNRSDVLDPALTRPGRFDRTVHVPLPDLVGRRQILEVHSKKIKLARDVDLDRIARGTPMFSGADLAAVINEAAILATLANKAAVELSDLEEARDKVRFGRANKTRRIEEQERVATAYHEAGHAIVQALLPDADPLHKVTIIPRGQMGGATFSLPEKDRYGLGAKYLNATMRVLCGGRIAEERKTSDVSSGAAMDIQQVTRFARHMILEWGMSHRLGFVNYAGEDSREMFIPEKDYSDETARIIDEEIKSLIDAAYADADRLITENWEKVVAVAEALLKYETLQGEEVMRIMRGERLDKPTISELLQAAANTSATVAPPAKSRESDKRGDEPTTGVLPSPA
ncbi:MAG TPA: ATP-dependent zinc metalloprotease FtsH [Phycisphaerales bacterium]|nr:ATP-dependent zinc metalloprotease FtsH [Phycisphaerales bacterium]